MSDHGAHTLAVFLDIAYQDKCKRCIVAENGDKYFHSLYSQVLVPYFCLVVFQEFVLYIDTGFKFLGETGIENTFPAEGMLENNDFTYSQLISENRFIF